MIMSPYNFILPQISTFLDVLQSKDNDTYHKFLKYLEEDYDWVAWSVKNTQISSAQLSEYASSRAATPETATMSSVERERWARDRRRAEDRVRDKERGGHEFRERERLPGPDSDRMSTSGYGSCAGDTSLPRGFSSPVHSSEFSLRSSHSGNLSLGSGAGDTLSISSGGGGGEITEDVIDFVKLNPRVMRRWQSLAHAAGLSHRVEVIKARIRAEGRDFDEHVEEFIREWVELSPETASLAGLVRLLRDLQFNDTALKLESGGYRSRRR